MITGDRGMSSGLPGKVQKGAEVGGEHPEQGTGGLRFIYSTLNWTPQGPRQGQVRSVPGSSAVELQREPVTWVRVPWRPGGQGTCLRVCAYVCKQFKQRKAGIES